jgi:hypothetical protein
MMDEKAIAMQLDSYMRFRADHEGVGYDLTPEFFRKWMKAGCFEFFGVSVNSSGLVEDDQQPELLSEWKRPRHHPRYSVT